ncbi:MAG: hypothetical protein N3F66_10575 [Spirochaetes bacterium]|nr:hypothetical protein [Spirochaetota bacterium]
MESERYLTLNMEIPSAIINIFTPILQRGFYVESVVGISVMEFLLNFGLEKEYIHNNIKTVFLNSKPVDDLNNAIINDNSTLSLSGAMPGLVGAVMRINSPFQSFRMSISHTTSDNEQTHSTKRTGLLNIKLFNTVLSNTANLFIQNGFLVDREALLSLIYNNKKDFKKMIIRSNGNRLNYDDICKLLSKHRDNVIKVKGIVIE